MPSALYARHPNASADFPVILEFAIQLNRQRKRTHYMKRESFRCLSQKTWLGILLTALSLPVFAQQPTVGERIAALKATMMASQVILRQYQWVETTTVTVNGEQKSQKQEQCYYGADGTLQKVILFQSPPEALPGGFFRRRIAERKQKELAADVQEATALIHQYIPLDQAKLQAAKDAGNVSVQMVVPGQRARLTFSNYAMSGDSLALDVNLTNNHPLAVAVSSMMNSDQSAVTINVTYGTLDDGTTYISGAVLNDPTKPLTITLQDSGYRKPSQ
jgi:hypothetical protein